MSIQGLIGRQAYLSLPSLLSATCANKKRTTAYENLTTATKTNSRDETAPSPIEEREKKTILQTSNIKTNVLRLLTHVFSSNSFSFFFLSYYDYYKSE